jgi:hypothetical protein
MSTFQRFTFGGLGGLLPVLVSLTAFQLVSSIIDNWDLFTLGNKIGYSISVIALCVLGGTVAALNSDIEKPWTLVQLGIAAPALITSYINGAAVSGATDTVRHATSSIAAISSAHAAEAFGQSPIISAGFLGDVLRGATVPLPKIQREKQQQQEQQRQQQQRQPEQQPRRQPQ